METAAGARFTSRSGSAEQTRHLGETLGRLVSPGDVILLQGDLGAGKTTFTQGIAAGAGTDELVNSPTFVLVNEYRGRIPIYHADLYRLDHPDDVARLDLANVSLDGALVVEWPERGDALLPAQRLLVRIAHTGPEERTLYFEPHGARARSLARALAGSLAPEPGAGAQQVED